jgi:1-acyl-sn-glycerol-3-phosphate acyltransferase
MDVNAFLATVVPAPGFVAKKAIYDIPLIAASARVWGCIAVDRDKKGESASNCQLLLTLLFPSLKPAFANRNFCVTLTLRWDRRWWSSCSSG